MVEEPRAWALVVPGHSERGRLSARCLTLVSLAAELAAHRAPRVVVFTGRPWAGGPSEAGQMLAAWRGRTDVELLVEPTARTTAENAARSLPPLLERGVARATVVCSPLHRFRAAYFFGGLYGEFGVECEIRAARDRTRAGALAWELGALALMRRQRRDALAEVRSIFGGGT